MSDWPLLLDFAQRHHGQPLALATLVSTEGSSYRQPGARLLIASDGSYCGSLSGGCLEEGLALAAQEVIVSGEPRRDLIDTRPHFGCPGRLEILTESLSGSDLLAAVGRSLQERQSFVLATSLQGTRVVDSASVGDGFLEEVCPPIRLVVVGATSDLEPVFSFGQSLGWDCWRIVNDARQLESTPSRSGERVVALAAGEVAARFPRDDQTAVLVMSHHLATDLAYLGTLVTGGYPYLGLLGSRRRRETLLTSLGDAGLLENPRWTENFHAPVGLDLGASHPSSIALAIVAEVQAVLSGRKGGFLRERVQSIHLGRVAR